MEKKEVELPGDAIVTRERDAKVEAEIQRRRGCFIDEKLEAKRGELGNKEFEKQRGKLEKEAESLWETMRKANAEFERFIEQAEREVMKWAPLEKVLRIKLEAEGYDKNVVENAVKARRSDFERLQRIVQERLRPKLDPDQDFRQRVLNSETRKEAIRHYLVDHIHKRHFLIEAFNLVFEELDKRK